MAFQLVMKTGPAPGRTHVIEKSEVSIGRDAGSEVFVNDVEVSREHARMTEQAGNYILEDLGSTNGTFINGQRLVGQRVLQPGDTITLGERVSFSFEAIPFDPNATQVSPTSPPVDESTPEYEPTPIPEEPAPMTPVEPVPPPIVEQAPPMVEQAPPRTAEQVYAGRVPSSPVEPLMPEESSPRRTWLWAGCGCGVVLLCALVGVAFVFDYINLYCTPPFRDVMVLFGAVCP